MQGFAGTGLERSRDNPSPVACRTAAQNKMYAQLPTPCVAALDTLYIQNEPRQGTQAGGDMHTTSSPGELAYNLATACERRSRIAR